MKKKKLLTSKTINWVQVHTIGNENINYKILMMSHLKIVVDNGEIETSVAIVFDFVNFVNNHFNKVNRNNWNIVFQ